jgi:uncharacterized protein YbjT (DUF2867 family)
LAVGDADDLGSIVRAAEGADAVYAMTTFFESGLDAEVRQGRNIAEAVRFAGIGHLVYASVGSAHLSTGVPHFESKYQIEQHIEKLGLPATIVRPVLFSENMLSPWTLPGLVNGKFALPVPPERPIQQISVDEISSFVVHVLENRDEMIDERIDIASDEVSGVEVARVLSDITGRSIEYVETSLAEAYEANKDAATMYEWFDRVGYSADIKGLRSAYPHIGWRTFEEWARSQDWSAVTAGAASVSP